MIDFKALKTALAENLVTIDIDSSEDFTISLPLLYYSGGWVLIKIQWNDDSFYVGDDGGAYVEALAIGAQDIFEEHARIVAEEYGVDSDGYEFFSARTTKDELTATIVLIANASIICARKVSEAQSKRFSEVRSTTEPTKETK
jgi:hypothetical protein